MKIKVTKNLGLAILLAGAILLCVACGKQGGDTAVVFATRGGDTESAGQTVKPDQPAEDQPEQEAKDQHVGTQNAEEQQEQSAFSFADVADQEFYFSSGAGGWRTVLYIHDDGSFEGEFSDSDMGSNGNDYPNGTVYYSEFSGAFTEPEPVDAYTWRLQIDHLEYAHEFGEEITDGFRYIYSDAYGVAGAEELYMYLPGVPIAQLPEAYRSWVGYYNLEAVQEAELPFYGLYNVTEGNGFSSYPIQTALDRVTAIIKAAEAADAELNAKLQEAYTQADMNILSGDLYQAWDDALNQIWDIFREELDDDSMKALTAEQLDWIARKETAVQAAGSEVEGGSMYPMVINGEAASWTRERVYVLAKYLE